MPMPILTWHGLFWKRQYVVWDNVLDQHAIWYYKLCWLHKRVILKIVKTWKPLGLLGWQFPMFPSHAVNIYITTHTEQILPFLSHPLCQVNINITTHTELILPFLSHPLCQVNINIKTHTELILPFLSHPLCQVNINITTHTEQILPFLSHPLCQVVCDTVQQLKTTTTFLFTNVLPSTLSSRMGTYWIHSL